MRLSKTAIHVVAFTAVLLATWACWMHAFAVRLSGEGQRLERLERARIEITETLRDLGTVTKTSILETEFTVKNIGNKRLLLSEQSRSCDCLSARKPQIVVPVGGQTRLKLVLDPSLLHGALRKQFTYQTNDPDCPALTLTVVAVIKPEEQKDD